jgi:hypothetical protein
MPIEQKNIDRLVKCLEMMASSHDGEALAAARAAVKIVKAANLQWKNCISITATATTQKSQNKGFGSAESFHDVVRRNAQNNAQSQYANQAAGQYNPYSQGPLGGGLGGMNQQDILRMMEMMARMQRKF